MSTELVTYSNALEPQRRRSVDEIIEEVKNIAQVLSVVKSGPTVIQHIEHARGQYMALLHLLSEDARIALLSASREGLYDDAIVLVDKKMSEFHKAGIDLRSSAANLLKKSFTEIDRDHFMHDFASFLRSKKINGTATIAKSNARQTKNEVAGARTSFGEVKKGALERHVEQPILDRFLEQSQSFIPDYLVLYIMSVDNPYIRDKALLKLVNAILNSMNAKSVSDDDKKILAGGIAEFVASIRNGKNPYILKTGEGAVLGTLPEIVPLNMEDVKKSLAIWMKKRARAIANSKNKKGRRKGKGKGGKGTDSELQDALRPIHEVFPTLVEGRMYLYWNNGDIDEDISMASKDDVKTLGGKIMEKSKANPGVQCVPYFYDKHRIEESLLLLARGEAMRFQIKNSDKVCTVVREQDGLLAIHDLLGNLPPELLNVTQEQILKDPYKYFSVHSISHARRSTHD